MAMAKKDICTSAPGKLMLFGEHAVLYGFPCLVAAVTPRAHVRLKPRSDQVLTITSKLGTYHTALQNIRVEEPFTFVLEAIRQASVKSGFDLIITCDFPADVGLGSSAAVTVATVAALAKFVSGTTPDRHRVFHQSLEIVRNVQGAGSGADLAAATFGGVLYLEAGGENLRCLKSIPPIGAVYSGSKEKTTVVIDRVKQAADNNPSDFSRIFEAIGQVVNDAALAMEKHDWIEVGKLMANNQRLMEEMGVSTPIIEDIVSQLNHTAGVYGAKISGSGLGDCVWFLGKPGSPSGLTPLDLSLDTEGLRTGG